jgi:hypothetical protein
MKETRAHPPPGFLKCVGTSLELKTEFGVGYKLTIVKDENSNQPEIDEFLRHFWKKIKKEGVKNIAKLHEGKVEVSYQISYHVSEFFPKFFKKLEKKSREIGIVSYGFHTTTLEEVFLKIAQQDDLEAEKRSSRIN